ncbi:MAG: ABC transporter permease [Caldilineaceae bacterium]|nr:ABC transporter permease [Caldilineaceae bacterium]MBP8107269.1 ABC transporter permease [Caldilineaceae bacterium]MBP8122366.1 ABC transporter permease [Caldilineaceae bacterium]MBP9071083.1 ABC transporter permease [Caldilineaceae bacterium]
MSQYILRRLLLAVPVLLGIIFVTFAMARLIPGDPCRAQLGERATDELCDAFDARYGLDKPIPIQFGIYMTDVLKGDLGESIRFGKPVSVLIIERLPMTVELSLAALIFAVMIGIPLGMLSALRHNSATDVVTMVGANMGVSMPVFWLGLMLAYLFAVVLKDTPFWLPPSGRLSPGLYIEDLTVTWGWALEPGGVKSLVSFVSNMVIFNSLITGNWEVFWDALKHLILPAVALGTIPLAIIARMTRSSLLEVLGVDYIRTARAKGLSERAVILRHAMGNAMLPVITIIGLSLGTLLGGAVLTETIFGLAGVGRMLYESITARDYTVVQGFTLVIAVGFVLVNLIVDVSYVFFDPRIRLE